jgi:hypothetical protein
MFAYLRAFSCVFVAAQLFIVGTAEAQSGEVSYARVLTHNDVREVLHCPWCTYPVSGREYFVRTVEGLNVVFDDVRAAYSAAELLNRMIAAQGQCDKDGYDLAFDGYVKMIALQKWVSSDVEEGDGMFGLLQPRRDLSGLTDIVVPSYKLCGRTVSAMRK